MGFFTKTGVILFGQRYAKSKVVDSLHVPHNGTFVTTEDGLKLAAWDLAHNDTRSKGTILMFHGFGSSRSGIIEEAESFYNLGWNVFMIDFRASGESEGNISSVGYYEVKDVKAAYDHVAATGEKNILMYGVSMGAATITKAMNDYPQLHPSKLILEMPFATMLNAVEGRVRIMNLPGEPFGVLLTFWGGTEMGVWAFSNKPEEYVKKISCPVLLQWGKKDQRVKEDETNEIYHNLASKQKTLVEYENAGHESLCINDHAKWMQSVSAFLDR
jgi:alpha-beta hydrolase superfamily lysophospholipase